ncbi:hypothetical protein BC828DRAFT_406366 [Blastocladiella britannica]|nr:hypothetical protein BC828DRAFT_406366 [Blastocladiella britannica]
MIDHVSYIVLVYAAGATRTPEEAVEVLNVLPAARSPLTLAVLSRGFREHDPSLAIKHGHAFTLLPHYPAHVLLHRVTETLKTAGALGDLTIIKFFWQLAGPA